MASLTKAYTKEKLNGQIYTPDFIVNKILDNVGYNSKEILGKTILDPACGDGRFLIGWKNPDFVNCNGEKICVEVANTFHHDENYPEKRKEHFKRWGWDCIVFRTNNLNENEVKIRLEEGGKICE